MSGLPIAVHGSVEQIDALKELTDDFDNLLVRVSPTTIVVSRNSPYFEALCRHEDLAHDEPLTWKFKLLATTPEDREQRKFRYDIVPIYLKAKDAATPGA